MSNTRQYSIITLFFYLYLKSINFLQVKHYQNLYISFGNAKKENVLAPTLPSLQFNHNCREKKIQRISTKFLLPQGPCQNFIELPHHELSDLRGPVA